MIHTIKKVLRNQQFAPGFWGLFTNPFYFARKGLYQHVQVLSKYLEGCVLDIGCGQKPYRHLIATKQYIGIEYQGPGIVEHSKADVLYSGLVFPFKSGSFDGILCNQVFEHVFTPVNFLNEINRVLKQDGWMIFTVPFVWDEHHQPIDYARYSSFGLRSLLIDAGFDVVQHHKTMNDVRTVLQLWNAYVYKKTLSKNGIINLLITVLLMAPVNILGELVTPVLGGNDDLYLDNVILARKARNV